jgi:hypothetical protein
MLRSQLFEFHEQTWCPALCRDCIRDALQIGTRILRMYNPVLPHLLKALEETGAVQVIDLCSGTGGPWLSLAEGLEGTNIRVCLTDLFPNVDAFKIALEESKGRIDYVADSTDATKVPEQLAGFRTLFASFHHFSPETARAILQDAADKGAGIAIFEMTERAPVAMTFVGLASIIGVVLVTLLIRPFSFKRLLFTYLIPVIPLMATFDGVVSCLRTYSPKEIQNLVDSLDAPGYRLQIGRVRAPLNPLPITYLIGTPAKAAASRET